MTVSHYKLLMCTALTQQAVSYVYKMLLMCLYCIVHSNSNQIHVEFCSCERCAWYMINYVVLLGDTRFCRNRVGVQ